ncbi:MAG: ATP-binding protein [Bacteroidetes bacterium HGW-Bacteroidetes-12]|nr:MAG: ATP-binding protein [Bacteroidetes bacterium HGW-Bacteroidetes-12]
MLTRTKSIHKTIIIHALLGIIIFYFIFHPITMVLYWYEFNKEPITTKSFFEVFSHRTLHSFSYKMLNMSLAFIIMGGAIGATFGMYRIKNKKLNMHLSLVKNDIKNLITQGENQYLELKSSIRYDYQQHTTNLGLEIVIAKTIVGFMNAKGGKLIVGVNDNGQILGLENDFKTLKQQNKDGFEQKIYEIISKFIGKEYCSYSTIYFYEIEKKYICVIDIQKPKEPAYLLKGTDTTFFLRTGNATRPLSTKEAVHYLNMEKENQ